MLSSQQLAKAACRQDGVDPTLFDFPNGLKVTRKDLERFRLAKPVCDACSIARDCLRDAQESMDWAYRGGRLLRAGRIQMIVDGATDEEKRDQHKTAFIDKNLGLSCKKGHPRTSRTIAARKNHHAYSVVCVPCDIMRKGLTMELPDYQKCDSEHWLVPENIDSLGHCIACTRIVRIGGSKRRTHCPQGHPYSGDNLKLQRTASGGVSQICLTCRRASDKKRWPARKKAA